MVTSIQLGNFFSVGGRTVLGGLSGSGLDTQALIEGLTAARRLPAVELEDKIALNAQKRTALSEFQTLLSTLKDSVNFLRNPPGVGNAADNAFKYTTATITSNFSTAGSTYVSVTAEPGSTPQSYTISAVNSIAKAKKQSTDNIAIADIDTASAVSAAPGADQFKAGTFTLNGEDITLVDGDSLSDVVAKINAVKSSTGIAAGIVQVSDGTYRISFSATATGTDADFDFNNVDVPGTLVDASGVFANFVISDTQEAADAEFVIDDVTITRQSNSIDDVIDGLTFTLLQVTPADPGDTQDIDVTVAADTQVIKNSIINFINAYNEIKVFAARQTALNDDGTFSEDAILANNPLFRSTLSSLEAEATSIVAGLAATNRLADIGITFIDLPESQDAEGTITPEIKNILTVDDAALTSAIAADPEAVRRLFEFDFTSDNPDLQVFSRTNALGVSEFTLTINPGTSTFEATYDLGDGPVTIDLDATAITGGTGYTLTGQVGTVLEGLVLIYGSNATTTIEVTATQGIADRLFNAADSVVKPLTGALALELDGLATTDEKLQADIDRIDEQVAAYREQLLAKFTALEQALSKVNTLLQALDAQDQARRNAAG